MDIRRLARRISEAFRLNGRSLIPREDVIIEADLKVDEIESIIVATLRKYDDRLAACGLRYDIDNEEYVPGDPEVGVIFHRGDEECFDIFSILEKEGFGRLELEEWLEEVLEEIMEKARRAS